MTLSTERTEIHSPTRLNRRRFVQGAAVTGVAVAITACAPVAPRPRAEDAPAALDDAPTISAAPARGRVARVRTDDRSEGLRRLLAMAGPLAVAGKQVVVKPNFNSADPAPGSTHPDILRGVVRSLHDGGASQIVVTDRSGMGNTRQVMAQLGVDRMAEEMDFDLVVLDELPAEAWALVDFRGSHWVQGFLFPKFVTEAGAIVQLCCLKTHRFGGHFTLSLKNSVGLAAKFLPGDPYNYMNELHGSAFQRTMIAEINTAYRPDLVVMDGVEAFVSGGPDRGEKVAANVMLAGADRVALDAVGVALLRYFGAASPVSTGAVFAQEQIARAVELDLGVSSPDQIDLLSDDDAGAALAAELEAILHAA